MPERTNSLVSHNAETMVKSGIEIDTRLDESLVCVYGRVDIESSPGIHDRLLTVLQDSGRKKVSIDFSAVTDIDSSGIATLIEALRIARSHNTELRLRGLNDRLHRFFELTGLLPIFNGSV